MNPQVLSAILWLLGGIGIGGMFFCLVLLRSASRDRRAYREEGSNGRPLMVIRTAMRRYAIAFVMFFLATCVAVVAAYVPIGIGRTSFNSFAVLLIFILKFVNIALDAKDDRDLIAYGIAKLKERDEARDVARDEGRDPERDAHRDTARDLEHDKQ